MSLHPHVVRLIDLGKTKTAPRYTQVVFGGVIVSCTHARRPRVLRLEPSKPRVGTKEIRL